MPEHAAAGGVYALLADGSTVLADDLPQVAGLDLNPVIARPDGGHVAGARVLVRATQPADPYLRRLR